MKENYIDIKSRIAEEPLWYDENGTPRYDPFHPGLCPNIYSTTVVLLRIACQDCGQEFDVEMHGSLFCPIEHPHKLHYGDPPSHGCAGDTMNCEDLEVLEVWYRKDGKWLSFDELTGVIGETNVPN
ncbi:hypothetical protein GF373_17800 [bacterium]|nr:hypothetical protein [bacterium]